MPYATPSAVLDADQAQLDKFYADENDRYRELARSINLQRQ